MCMHHSLTNQHPGGHQNYCLRVGMTPLDTTGTPFEARGIISCSSPSISLRKTLNLLQHCTRHTIFHVNVIWTSTFFAYDLLKADACMAGAFFTVTRPLIFYKMRSIRTFKGITQQDRRTSGKVYFGVKLRTIDQPDNGETMVGAKSCCVRAWYSTITAVTLIYHLGLQLIDYRFVPQTAIDPTLNAQLETNCCMPEARTYHTYATASIDGITPFSLKFTSESGPRQSIELQWIEVCCDRDTTPWTLLYVNVYRTAKVDLIDPRNTHAKMTVESRMQQNIWKQGGIS